MAPMLHSPALAEQRIPIAGDIPAGINIGVGGLKVLIDHNAVVDREVGFLSQLDVRYDARTDADEIAGQLLAGCCQHAAGPAIAADLMDVLPRMDHDTLFFAVGLN